MTAILPSEQAAVAKQPSLEEIVAKLNPDANDPNFRWPPLPDHTTLPDHDDAVENYLEHPKSMLLTETIQPALRAKHPDGQFAIGSNSGVYWKMTNQPLEGCKAPDWYYVPDVHPTLVEGVPRRSYALWREGISPFIIIEFASGDGSEERDRTPGRGKFWVYYLGTKDDHAGREYCGTVCQTVRRAAAEGDFTTGLPKVARRALD